MRWYSAWLTVFFNALTRNVASVIAKLGEAISALGAHPKCDSHGLKAGLLHRHQRPPVRSNASRRISKGVDSPGRAETGQTESKSAKLRCLRG